MISAHYLPFDPERLPLAPAAAQALGVERLDCLAESERARKRESGRPPALGYRDNMRLRARLAALAPDHPLLVLYGRLVREVVAPAFGGGISYNARPTFRVHMAGTPSVSAWHRDADVTGRLDYITGWVPFVDTYESNGLWLEQHYGAADYQPVPAAYGEVVIFDGALARHGSQPNRTSVSRVSMDFRFVPKDLSRRGPIADAIQAGRRAIGPQASTRLCRCSGKANACHVAARLPHSTSTAADSARR